MRLRSFALAATWLAVALAAQTAAAERPLAAALCASLWFGHADDRRPGDRHRHGRRPGPVFLAILTEFRGRYLRTYTPPAVLPGGCHALDVRVARRGARVNARPGYFSATP